jgi:hypothetical protein
MSYECRQMTVTITEVLRTESGAAEFRALMQRNASNTEIAEAFATHCEPADAALMIAEFAELPRSFVGTFMDAWLMADAAGRRFELASRPPTQPLDFARRDCVAFSLEHDQLGVTMYVSHVHGRHADWYKPAAAATR